MPKRESSAAIAAFNMYLELPKPRRLSDLDGRPLPSQGKAPPFFLKGQTVRVWSQKYHWAARAEEFDRDIAERQQAALKTKRVSEIVKREQRRLRDAEDLAEMAFEYLHFPDTWPEEAMRGKRKPLDMLDPVRVKLCLDILKQTADTERLDLGQATSRHELMGDGVPQAPQNIVVVTPQALDEMRGIVKQLATVAPKSASQERVQRIIDAEDGQFVEAT